MNHRRISILTLATLVTVGGSAHAGGLAAAPAGTEPASSLTTSAFTLPPEGAAPSLVLATTFAPEPFAMGHAPAGTRLDAVRYRPRSYSGGGRGNVGSSPTQLHAGFFEPDGNGATSFAFGFRGGPAIDERIQIGLGLDWYHKSETQRVVTGDPYFVGGNIVRPTRVLSKASSDLLPITLFMQASGGDNLQVIPYFGVAGGYEVMLLSATDYQSQQDFDATFGGWGWQVWGGAALPLSGRTRLIGEVFVNQGDVERDVTDSNGNSFRERVDADGVGMRFGLNWGF